MAAVNVGVAHSNQWNFLQHSEEPVGRMKSVGGTDLARGPGVWDPCYKPLNIDLVSKKWRNWNEPS